MADLNYSELPNGNLLINKNFILPIFQDSQTRQILASNAYFGKTVDAIYTSTDLPTPVSGNIPLDPLTSYNFMEPGGITDSLLLPAGYIGKIKSTFIQPTGLVHAGSEDTPMFKTLNIDGTITSIADSVTNPGVKSTITVSVAHGILDGQFVNITDTLVVPVYSQQRLLVSNVTTTTFDVVIAFAGTDTGLFNTGYETLVIADIDLASTGSTNLLDITSSGSISSILQIMNVTALGFKNIGIIRKPTVVTVNAALFASVLNGLIIENAVNIDMIRAGFLDLGTQPSFRGLTLTGAATRRVVIDVNQAVLTNPLQRPVRIDPSVILASINISNSPDNGVADAYFDTSTGGLDQTNPQVITKGNGTRPDSMSSAQVGFTNIADDIEVVIVTEDVPVIIGGTQFISNNLERASATTAGQITNLNLKTKKYPITFSGLIEKVGGGSTDIGLLLIKNGSLVLTNTFEIPHSVNPGIIQISATRDFELAVDDTLDLAVVNFDGTANISVVQANISYSVDA